MFRQLILLSTFLIALVSASKPVPGCAAVLCKFGFKCIETPNGGKCVPTCRVIKCAPGYKCVETPTGATCKKTGPTCKTIRCAPGFTCVDKPHGSGCVPCVCTADFRPVCCQFKDGKKKTVSNECACTGCGALNKILHKGPCRKPCICAEIYKPVCCRTKKGTFTAPNRCECKCKGGWVIPRGCKIYKK